jgi:hypothetical protein
VDAGSWAEWAGAAVPVVVAGVSLALTRKRLLVERREGDLVAAQVRAHVVEVINTGLSTMTKDDLVRPVKVEIHRGKWDSFKIEYVQRGGVSSEPVGHSVPAGGDPSTEFVVDRVDLDRGDRLKITMFVKDGRDLLPQVSLQAKGFRVKRRTFRRR